MELAEALVLTGMKESEITGLEESPAGDLIHCFDGSTLVNVTAPDADGKTGLMYLVAPHDPYSGSLPVYAQPTATGATAEPAESASVAVVADAVEAEPVLADGDAKGEAKADGSA